MMGSSMTPSPSTNLKPEVPSTSTSNLTPATTASSPTTVPSPEKTSSMENPYANCLANLRRKSLVYTMSDGTTAPSLSAWYSNDVLVLLYLTLQLTGIRVRYLIFKTCKTWTPWRWEGTTCQRLTRRIMPSSRLHSYVVSVRSCRVLPKVIWVRVECTTPWALLM